MPRKRKHIPVAIQRSLYEEAGWRCAVATCRASNPLEIAHIDPVAKDGDNDFYNLIVLCRNCHGRFHDKSEQFMTLQAMVNIKKNLMILNGRYNSFEIRLMEGFLNNPEQVTVWLFGRDIDVMYLVKDGLIKDSGMKLANSIGFPPKEYMLTEVGKDFIQRWKTAKELDEA